MEQSKNLVFDCLPFIVGTYGTPSNPGEVPNSFPFELEINNEVGLLEQKNTPELEALLCDVYRLGNEMGTPLSETNLGVGYVRDFLSFLTRFSSTIGRALEIGAGVGYLSSELQRVGWLVDSLEPGSGYQQHWQNYGIKVINDYFPSRRAQGPFDLILFGCGSFKTTHDG